MSSQTPTSQFLVYQTDDGTIKIDVRFQNETVWLTQQERTPTNWILREVAKKMDNTA